MEYMRRAISRSLDGALKRGKSVLLLGPRQTGKTTLIKNLDYDLYISFVNPQIRQRYEKKPNILQGEIDALSPAGRQPIVLLDEVQKVPEILDVAQEIIDNKKAIFVFTGSSARKLKRGHDINLLPGRVVAMHLMPFMYSENKNITLNEFLMYGSLPGISLTKNNADKETDLSSYVVTYLEEEIRSEALVRNVGSFGRFLELAASESGQIINSRKLSNEIGVAHTTIASYFEILEDCLIINRIDPITESKTRKKLSKSKKYLFFDLGVRRVAAREGISPNRTAFGSLFEQFVGLELIKIISSTASSAKLRFWRDHDGPEVDWVVEKDNHFTPVEVKFTDSPSPGDIKHLETFISEYAGSSAGYLVCRVPRKIKLSKKCTAIPWQEMEMILEQN